MPIYNLKMILDTRDFPMLNNLKHSVLKKTIMKMFKIGYNVLYPPNEQIQKRLEINQILETVKRETNNENLTKKIDALENSLTKLIGLSTNSNKKGNFAENMLEDVFGSRYGDINFERKSNTPHSGDAWLYLPNNKIIMLESKNYTNTVNKDEIIKMENDMKTHHIKWGLFASFNSKIQGMRDLDFHAFTHNNETYYVLMISNLSQDINKLDMGLEILRKLILNLDNVNEFPWIVQDISSSLNQLNSIVQKNYLLRDSFYEMEKNMQKQLSSFHQTLRNYQYELDHQIKEITDKIQNTIKESITNKQSHEDELLEKYKSTKTFDILSRMVDIAKKRKFQGYWEDENFLFKYNNETVLKMKIQIKKIIVNIIKNDLTINLNVGKEKENKDNLKLIKNFDI
jgi:hypothetical protein